MKIRNGFVSNSSSSSFCIYGVDLDFSDLIEKVKENKLITEDVLNDLEKNDEWWELGEVVESQTGLEVHTSDDYAWIGKSWSSIGDNETGLEFKNSVKVEMKKLLGEDSDCRTHEEVIYN